MEIAYYDNATAYNDSVVCRILKSLSKRDAVVVYVADHGEEVHDFRNQYGRTMGTITKGIAENIYRVPLLIYITPEFRRNHDTIYQMLKSVGNQKIYTGDIGQLLLHLGGIKTRFRDPHRSPLSSQYSSGSRCILDGKVDYDKLLQEHLQPRK